MNMILCVKFWNPSEKSIMYLSFEYFLGQERIEAAIMGFQGKE
jgi:hypothetical protein